MKKIIWNFLKSVAYKRYERKSKKGVKMNIVSGVNPQTKKKETYKFKDTNKGFWEAQEKLDELKRSGYKKTSHEGKTALSNIWNL